MENSLEFFIKQARFQQKQLQEKEEKLLKLYEEQQKRAMRSVGSHRGGSLVNSEPTVGGGKVRYLFQSRRRTSEGRHGVAITGRDKSYPLEPLTKYQSARNLDLNHQPGTRHHTQTTQWGPHQRSVSLDRHNSDLSRNRHEYLYELRGETDDFGYDDYDEVTYSSSGGRRQAGRIQDFRRGASHSDLHYSGETEFGYYEKPDGVRYPRPGPGQFGRHDFVDRILTNSTTANSNPYLKRDGIADQMDRKFRSYVSQGTTLGAKKAEGPKEAPAGPGAANSPVRKIRKPTPVPLSVAPPSHLFQMRRTTTTTTRSEPIPENGAASTRSTTSPRTSQLSASSGSSSARARTTTTTTASRTSAPTRLPPSGAKPGLGSVKSSPPSDLVDCSICGRHFAKDRVSKHEEVCRKSTKSKRKPFDALQQRVKGTDVEKYIRKSSKVARAQPEKPAAKPQSNWRKKHEEFIQNIRAAKEVTAHLKRGGKLSDLPPPPPSDYSDYIQCPHCSRKFNSTAAERHIPKCANMLHNKPKPGLQKTTAATGAAGALKPGSKLLTTASPPVRGRK